MIKGNELKRSYYITKEERECFKNVCNRMIHIMLPIIYLKIKKISSKSSKNDIHVKMQFCYLTKDELDILIVYHFGQRGFQVTYTLLKFVKSFLIESGLLELRKVLSTKKFYVTRKGISESRAYLRLRGDL